MTESEGRGEARRALFVDTCLSRAPPATVPPIARSLELAWGSRDRRSLRP